VNTEKQVDKSGQFGSVDTLLNQASVAFKVNGTTVNVPISIKEFEKLGYQIEDTDDNMVSANTETRMTFSKNKVTLGTLLVKNLSSNDSKLSDCTVTGICVIYYRRTAYSMELNDEQFYTKVADVEKKYGIPAQNTTTTDGYNRKNGWYYYILNNKRQMAFLFSKGSLIGVDIKVEPLR
jgi:hypothetical protein